MSNRKLPDIPLPSFENAASSAAGYRTAAGRLRKMAQQSISPRSRADMLALVAHFDRMAAHLGAARPQGMTQEPKPHSPCDQSNGRPEMPAVSVQTATTGAAIPDRIQTREQTAIAMTPIGIKEAVRRTGRNKGTIHKAMTTGKLPFTLSPDGIRRIDPAELERVFPGKHQAQPRPKPKKKKRYPSTVRIDDAAALQQRIADGQATPDEAQHYDKIIRDFRRRFVNGQLAPATARRFGIE